MDSTFNQSKSNPSTEKVVKTEETGNVHQDEDQRSKEETVEQPAVITQHTQIVLHLSDIRSLNFDGLNGHDQR